MIDYHGFSEDCKVCVQCGVPTDLHHGIYHGDLSEYNQFIYISCMACIALERA